MMTRTLPRLLIAAPSSGAGKTTCTCALLKALMNGNLKVQAFKSGPDFVDPMFHQEVIGTPSGNLDLFLQGEEAAKALLAKRSEGADIAIIESAMGYYDGMAATDEASGYALACVTGTPAVLVVDARKSALSLAATIRGFASFRPDANIRGVILNHASAPLYGLLHAAIENETGIPVLGYLPYLKDCVLESRHLGLVTAMEVMYLRQKIDRLAAVFAENVDVDGLLSIAKNAEPFSYAPLTVERRFDGLSIGVARDSAFCFLYAETLQLLETLGAKLRYFSPLEDAALPDGIHGLLLPGGYPELHAKALADNASMRRSIRVALRSGLPCIAEGGGFLYLHTTLEDANGQAFPMVGYSNPT